MKWSPTEIGDLFIDAQDYMGLEFWYNDIKEVTEVIKKK